jgi:hypothetical protein
MIRVIAGFCLITIVTICAAQQDNNKHGQPAKPDLSGTWVLVQPKSNLGKGLKVDITDYILTIVHREPEIRITKTFKTGGREYVGKSIYYTDGRQEILPTFENIEVHTKWRGTKLYRRESVKRNIPFSSIPNETVTEEEWELSEDGTLLTRTISKSTLGRPGRSDGNEPSHEKYVFTRS